jgi:hypothetical protein
VELGEQMCVIVYRMYGYDDKRTYLLKNEELQGAGVVTL